MDRRFFSTKCISILCELELKFLMPAVKNRKIRRMIKETKEFPAVVPYTMRNGKKSVTFPLVLLEGTEKKRRKKRRGKTEKRGIYLQSLRIYRRKQRMLRNCLICMGTGGWLEKNHVSGRCNYSNSKNYQWIRNQWNTR